MNFVYLHGMGGGPQDWAAVEARLPGRALTIPTEGGIAGALTALAAEIGEAKNTAICGYSMGGRLAILLAAELAKGGNPPGGLALLGAGMGFSSAVEREGRLSLDEKWAELAEWAPQKFWDEWYHQPLFASFQALPVEARAAWLKSRFSMDIKRLSAQLRLFGPACHDDLQPVVGELLRARISVLYLAGELDKKYLHLGQVLSQQQGLALEIIPGAGHILPLEAPNEVASRLKAFFSAAQ